MDGVDKSANFQPFDRTESYIDSASSELERLGVESALDGSVCERGFAKSKHEEDIILNSIRQVSALGTTTIDLSGKGLLQIPDELLELSHLEHLYLEGNHLGYLPDEFFERLPNLKWLDLRRNQLVRLPSVYTGRHQHLRNLLLEGNQLRSLPLELGLIQTLHGLNIKNNPLEFPPQYIIEKGTHETLQFLFQMLNSKTDHGNLSNGGGQEDHLTTDIHQLYSVTDGPGNWNDEFGENRTGLQYQRPDSSYSTQSNQQDLVGPIPSTAELHKPLSYGELKQQHVDKLKKAGAFGTVENFRKALLNRTNAHRSFRKLPVKLSFELGKHKSDILHRRGKSSSSISSVSSWKVNPYPEPPPPDYVTTKMKEERRLAKVKELREKQDAILQRRRDEDMLKDWRMESKKLQQKKYIESMRNGGPDFIDAPSQAPFGIDKEHMKVPTNQERIKEDVKNAHEKIRRSLSPASRQRIELEKNARIRELERRIKEHTLQMHERRKKPQGSPQEEMMAAKRELEIADTLHKELLKRRKDIEYRFKAFSADISSGTRTRGPKMKT